jgi:hypothetical protein
LSLIGEEACTWRELLDSDLELHEEVQDGKVLRRLAKLGTERSRRHAAASHERKKTLSWIWTAMGGPNRTEEEDIHDGNGLGNVVGCF